MGSKPEMENDNTAATPVPRAVNRQLANKAYSRSQRQRQFRLWTFVIVALMALATVAAYLYLTRAQPVVTLKVAAGPYRSDSYELMKEVADVVERQSTTLRLELISTSDSSRNISILNAGQVDLATIRSDTPAAASVRMVADMFPDFFQIIAKAEDGLFSVQDLAGKRVAIPPFGYR